MPPLANTSDRVMTVSGEKPLSWEGAVDAHNHVWIAPPDGAPSGSPVLDRFQPILDELQDYHAAGGQAIIDCQPGGCGRDARQLAALSAQSGVDIVCCTGFHRRRYYPPSARLWQLKCEALADIFTSEMLDGVEETLSASMPVRAGFLKVALEDSLAGTPQAALEAAANTAIRTGAAIQIHTEKGAAAEEALDFFIRQNVRPQKLILCHMDKRPKPSLHKELAQAGVLLEYDTFYRPQYYPEQNLWPLLRHMLSAGYGASIALATDMADASQWKSMGQGPGLASLPRQIRRRLAQEGVPAGVIQSLIGGNILARLAKPPLNPER